MNANKKILVAALLCFCFLSFIASVILSSSPFNPLTLPYSNASIIYKIVPQGFAFFTRDAREPALLFYKKTDEGDYLVNHSSAAPDNLFGLSRKSRRENLEIAHILSKVKKHHWTECPQGKVCKPDSLLTIKNDFPGATLKGRFIAKQTTPIPWAWSKSYEKIIMKHQLVEIIIP